MISEDKVDWKEEVRVVVFEHTEMLFSQAQ